MHFVCFVILLALNIDSIHAQEPGSKQVPPGKETNLVRVNIISETRGSGESVVINGRRLPNYQPRIIQVFPSTGIILDEQGHILTFLGYRWVEIQSKDPRIEIITAQGRMLKGKLIGIDQSVGAAVILSLEGGLKKTPLCEHCEIKHGATVISPMAEDDDGVDFAMKSARILSVLDPYPAPAMEQGWVVTINRPLPGIGEPLLDAEHRVLGFVLGQKPSPDDPMGIQTVVYPISKLLMSADKILKTGGDIQSGWLGVYLDETGPAPGAKVIVRSIERGSPAQSAGLLADDVILKWNGKQIQNTRDFIQMVQQTPIGARVKMDVMRQGRTILLSALIESRKPQPNPGPFVFNFPDMISLPASDFPLADSLDREAKNLLGLDAVPLTPQLADSLRLTEQSGLLVIGVQEKLPFGRAGIKVGDVLLAANDQPIVDSQILASQIRSGIFGSRLILRILRKGIERTATIVLSKPQPRPRASAPK